MFNPLHIHRFAKANSTPLVVFQLILTGHKEFTLSQRAELAPAADGTLLCVLTDRRLQQEDWQATKYSKETVGHQERTCTQVD